MVYQQGVLKNEHFNRKVSPEALQILATNYVRLTDSGVKPLFFAIMQSNGKMAQYLLGLSGFEKEAFEIMIELTVMFREKKAGHVDLLIFFRSLLEQQVP